MESTRLQTATLRDAPWGAGVSRILAAALAGVEPAAAVRRHLRRDGAILTAGAQSYDLASYQRVFLVGAGKAGAPMARAVAEQLDTWLTEGVIIVKDTGAPPEALPHPVALLAARHPLPDERGIQATQRIGDLLLQATADDLIVVVLSGGGSALLTLPAPEVSLHDLQQLTDLLLRCGASIDEINCLRKHLDLIKGGGLARMAAPAHLLALVLSDVVGNPLDVIASGPAVPDHTTFADAMSILERYSLLDAAPAAVVARLQAGVQGEIAETPKAGDPIFAHTQHLLVGSNQHAAAAALHAAQAEGYHTALLTSYAQGEARVVGRLLAAIARELVVSSGRGGVVPPLLPRPACLVIGGETTVTLQGSGKGGRNQEMALAAVADLAGLSDVAIVTLATDGGDGPTDAAGAVVTGATLARAQAMGLNPAAALANNDAYPFFAALDDLLRPGATRTNVNDLAFIFTP